MSLLLLRVSQVAAIGVAAWGMFYISMGQLDLFGHAEPACKHGGVKGAVLDQYPALCPVVAFGEGLYLDPRMPVVMTKFSAMISVCLVIQHLEASKPGAPFIIRYSPFVTALASQTIGAGIAFPLWFLLFSFVAKSGPSTGRTGSVRTLFPSLVLGFFTTTFAADLFNLLSRDTKQYIGLVFQVYPVTVLVLQMVLRLFLPSTTRTPEALKQATLTRFFVLLTLIHWMVMYKVYLMAQTSKVSMLDILAGINDVKLKTGVWGEAGHTFIMFDAFGTLVGTLAFVLFAPGRRGSVFVDLIKFILLFPIAGPSAAALYIYKTKPYQGTP